MHTFQTINQTLIGILHARTINVILTPNFVHSDIKNTKEFKVNCIFNSHEDDLCKLSSLNSAF